MRMDTLRGGYGGSIPANYDRYLRSFLFERYADDLINRLKRKPKMRILETACGTGVVTERLERALGADATIIASDLNPAMIDFARTRLSDSNVTWQSADALELPFEDASFDAVVCQFGWMFFPDKVRGARESRRVLVSGGQLLFNVWESLERNEVGHIVQSTLDRLFGDAAPTFLHVPYGYHNSDTIADVLEAAHFGEIQIVPVELECTCHSAEAAARGYIEGTPTANELSTRGPEVLQHVLDETTKDITARLGRGPLRVKLHALVCSGVAAS
jgi:ubiquinone/menaquinone biosynthesis C-methylase UbiE